MSWRAILTGSLLILPLVSHSAEIEVAVAEGVPGTIVTVPVMINDASGIASMRAQVNYDPLFLDAYGVTNGSPNDPAYVGYGASQGAFDLFLGAESNLPAGPRTMAIMKFQVNQGAKPGDFTPLVLADHDLGEQHGGSLRWTTQISGTNGGVWIVHSKFLDSDDDGLSDYDEQMVNGSPDYDPLGGDTDVNNPDSDGDQMPDGWEHRYGLNPLVHSASADTDQDGFSDYAEWITGTAPDDINSFLYLEGETSPDIAGAILITWPSTTSRTYTIDRSASLMGVNPFSNIVSGIIGQIDSTTYTDTTAVGAGTLYYRVGAEIEAP